MQLANVAKSDRVLGKSSYQRLVVGAVQCDGRAGSLDDAVVTPRCTKPDEPQLLEPRLTLENVRGCEATTEQVAAKCTLTDEVAQELAQCDIVGAADELR